MIAAIRHGWSRYRWAALVVVAGGALVAAACGGGTSSSDKTATASAGRTSAPTASAATPASGGASTSEAGEAGEYATPGAGSTAPAASGASTVKLATAGSLGTVLTGPNGMTLYIFKNDTAGNGKSACSGGCATNWPPLTIASGSPVKPDGLSGDLVVITRDDGKMQVTYKGLPLYYFAGDKAPGDTNGQGVGNIWFAATP